MRALRLRIGGIGARLGNDGPGSLAVSFRPAPSFPHKREDPENQTVDVRSSKCLAC